MKCTEDSLKLEQECFNIHVKNRFQCLETIDTEKRRIKANNFQAEAKKHKIQTVIKQFKLQEKNISNKLTDPIAPKIY